MSSDTLRAPPHSLDAERAIIGACLIDPRTYDRVRDLVTVDDFYQHDHRTLWVAIAAIAASKIALEPIALRNWLAEHDFLEQAGGLEYLGALYEHCPSSANAEHYARVIHQKASIRRVLTASVGLSERCYGANGIDVEALVDEAVISLRGAAGLPEVKAPIDILALPGTYEEYEKAALHPPCIVNDLFFADLGILIADGGAGKTTLVLFMAVHVILGLPIFGLEIKKTGRVLFVTAEDPKERLLARVREILNDLDVTEDQRREVYSKLLILDVIGEDKKLVEVNDRGGLTTGRLVFDLVDAFLSDPPLMMIFDPLAALGAPESTVNDGLEACNSALGYINKHLGCLVYVIHHMSRAAAKDGTVTQHAFRGGTSMPNRARMVHILSPCRVDNIPVEFLGAKKRDVSVFLRDKNSHGPKLKPIYINRMRYSYDYAHARDDDPGELFEAQKNQILTFIESQRKLGKEPTQRSIEKEKIMSRSDAREAIADLLERGAIRYEKSDNAVRGGARKYLVRCADDPGAPK